MAALYLPPQNLPILVPQRTKRSGTEQNNLIVTGPSIKLTSSGGLIRRNPNEHRVKKNRSHSYSTHLTKESTTNFETGLANMGNANEDIVAEIHAEMRDSQDLVHFLQSSPQKRGPSWIQPKTTELILYKLRSQPAPNVKRC